MSDTSFEYIARPGSSTLSVVSFVGLGALATFLWQLAPGLVLLILVPALAICAWQVMNVPSYGIKITDETLHLIGGDDDIAIPVNQIVSLRTVARGEEKRIRVMMDDGSELQLPVECVPDADVLLSAAQERGIAVS